MNWDFPELHPKSTSWSNDLRPTTLVSLHTEISPALEIFQILMFMKWKKFEVKYFIVFWLSVTPDILQLNNTSTGQINHCSVRSTIPDVSWNFYFALLPQTFGYPLSTSLKITCLRIVIWELFSSSPNIQRRFISLQTLVEHDFALNTTEEKRPNRVEDKRKY